MKDCKETTEFGTLAFRLTASGSARTRYCLDIHEDIQSDNVDQITVIQKNDKIKE